jgi:hypothetical protein
MSHVDENDICIRFGDENANFTCGQGGGPFPFAITKTSPTMFSIAYRVSDHVDIVPQLNISLHVTAQNAFHNFSVRMLAGSVSANASRYALNTVPFNSSLYYRTFEIAEPFYVGTPISLMMFTSDTFGNF